MYPCCVPVHGATAGCAACNEWLAPNSIHQLQGGTALHVASHRRLCSPSGFPNGLQDVIADETLRVMRRCVPAAVPGIMFLSGGQVGAGGCWWVGSSGCW